MLYKSLEKRKEYVRERYFKTKEFLIDLKKNSGGCFKCGWKKVPEVLEFHHFDREKKSFNLTGKNLSFMSRKKLMIEISKCKIICPNCHRILHMKDGNFHGCKRV